MVKPLLIAVANVVRLSRPRYLALTVTPFAAGVIGSPGHDVRYLWVGIPAIVLLRAISSIGNCISDRVEDAIDHSHRAMLCQQVGYATLERVVQAAVACFLVLVVVMVAALHVSPAALTLWLAYLLLKLTYSFGPRLKPRRYSATVLLGGIAGAMFFVGWIGGGIHDGWTALAGGILLWVMGASLAGSKDAPNLAGDAEIGYRSVYRDLVEDARPLRRALILASRPYLTAIAIAAVGFALHRPTWQVLWCLTVAPIAVVFVVLLIQARTEVERSLVRELGYLYWLIFMGVVLVSLIPQQGIAALALGSIMWYLLASVVLHPDPTPYGLGDLRTARKALSRGRWHTARG